MLNVGDLNLNSSYRGSLAIKLDSTPLVRSIIFIIIQKKKTIISIHLDILGIVYIRPRE